MSKNFNKDLAPVSSQPTQEELQKLFISAYTELCKKHKMQVGFAPQWKQSADTGTYSLVILASVVEFIPQP